MKEKDRVICKLCGEEAEVRFRGQPGYREPQTYDIVHCGSCGTAYALPLEVNSEVYEYIYRNRSLLPGYQRYVRYAEMVLKEHNPIGYLEKAEDVYWAVTSYLDRVPNTSRILEVGCGLGYLTYGIFRRGYDILGIDISATAVEDALRKYGNLYVCADIFEYSRNNAVSFDVVIMTEVIEHVPNPVGFLEAAGRLLRAGGEIVVTTPNRSVFHETVLWQTETPPVHLWWFSEDSLRLIAHRLGFSVSFTDFREYSKCNPIRRRCELSLSLPTRGSALKEDGSLLSEREERAVIRGLQRYYFKKLMFKVANQLLRFRDMTRGGSKRGIICATFTK